MGLNVAKEVATMERMTVPELRARYAEVFGEECRSRHKQLLVKRIAWRLQAQVEGDLSEKARMRAAELANDADLRMYAMVPRKVAAAGLVAAGTLTAAADNHRPLPGTVLTREYKGREVRVLVLDKGFEYEGDVYRSLSAVAKAVTGSHWNGNLFFRLREGSDEA
jgi:hypothetical protein